MKNNKYELIRQTFTASQTSTIHFGQVITALTSVDVAPYFTDHCRRQETCYFPSNNPLQLSYEADDEVFHWLSVMSS